MFLKQNGPISPQKFQSRAEAGQILSDKLKTIIKGNHLLICAIPRGGVIIGAEIAKNLAAPLTVLPIKKIGTPGNPELAIGAVGPWGKPIFDKQLISVLQVSPESLETEVKKTKREVKRRMLEFGIEKLNCFGKTVVLTDDGVATGSTIILAAKLIRSLKPAKLILAVPVTPRSKLRQLKKNFDDIIILLKPKSFRAVGQFYSDFPQVTDEEVKQLLKVTKKTKATKETKED